MRPFLVAALIGLAAALTAPTGANAAACSQRVLDDWRDGRLDHVYPVHCYRDALRNLPEDLRVYGTAESDIQSALTRALARSAAEKHQAAPVAAQRTTTGAKSAAPSKPERTPEVTRTLAGHSTAQPKLRLTAAAKQDAGRSGFPFTAVVAGAVALGVALLALVPLRRHFPRRLTP